MSEYLILAENITYKNNKLSCINIYDNFSAVALPAEFVFDLVVIFSRFSNFINVECGITFTVDGIVSSINSSHL